MTGHSIVPRSGLFAAPLPSADVTAQAITSKELTHSDRILTVTADGVTAEVTDIYWNSSDLDEWIWPGLEFPGLTSYWAGVPGLGSAEWHGDVVLEDGQSLHIANMCDTSCRVIVFGLATRFTPV